MCMSPYWCLFPSKARHRTGTGPAQVHLVQCCPPQVAVQGTHSQIQSNVIQPIQIPLSRMSDDSESYDLEVGREFNIGFLKNTRQIYILYSDKIQLINL